MPAISTLHDANVRSMTYQIARTSAQCPHCGVSTGVAALVLPPGHEALDIEASEDNEADVDAARDDAHDATIDDAPGAWQGVDANAILFYVEQIPDGVQQRLRRMSRHFRLARSPKTQGNYWGNHCQHCDALLEDHELHCEPGAAFMPTSEAAASTIKLSRIDEPFQAAAAGYALEPEFFPFARRG